jgi:hypothetical protein
MGQSSHPGFERYRAFSFGSKALIGSVPSAPLPHPVPKVAIASLSIWLKYGCAQLLPGFAGGLCFGQAQCDYLGRGVQFAGQDQGLELRRVRLRFPILENSPARDSASTPPSCPTRSCLSSCRLFSRTSAQNAAPGAECPLAVGAWRKEYGHSIQAIIEVAADS